MSDSCTKPSDDIIDILVCVVDLDKRINKNNYKEKELTIEKIKSICQELLLRLHPDKKSSDSADTDSSKESETSEFSNVLAAWKFLSKYSNIDDNDELARKILSRQYELIDETSKTISKPLWKVIPLKQFIPIGRNHLSIILLIPFNTSTYHSLVIKYVLLLYF